MKTKISLIFGIWFVSAVGFANECLKQSSHSQLLNEVERRLNNGGGNGDTAILNAICSNNRLIMSVIDVNGRESILAVIDTPSREDCGNTVSELMNSGSEIKGTSIVAACSNNLFLVRFSITSAGVGRQLDNIRVASVEDCVSQRSIINSKR